MARRPATGRGCFDDLCQTPEMRAGPVDAIAGVAGPELIIVAQRVGREPPCDARLVDALDRAVATQAASEGPDRARQVEARDDLAELIERSFWSHVAAVSDDPMHEEASIAGQHDPAFLHAQARHLLVLKVVTVERVETEEPQKLGQGPEVGVGYEPYFAQWPFPDPQERADIECLELRIHADPIAVSDRVGEADGYTVHQDQLDLGVGHAERLDGVLHRRVQRDAAGEGSLTALGGEEVVQLLVEPKQGPGHGEA